MSTRPKARTNLGMVELDGEIVIYDDETADVHYLSSTAALVFRLCDGTGTVPELAADIADAFGAPVDQVEDHIHQLVGQFREAGLLAGSMKVIADPRKLADEPPPESLVHEHGGEHIAEEHHHDGGDDPHHSHPHAGPLDLAEIERDGLADSPAGTDADLEDHRQEIQAEVPAST